MKTFSKSLFLITLLAALPALASFEVSLSPDGPAESRFHESYETREQAKENLADICAHFPSHKAVLVNTTTEEEEVFSCAEINAGKKTEAAGHDHSSGHSHHQH